MSTAPPSGYGYHAATWDVAGSLRQVVCTMGFANPGNQTAANINALMSTTILFQSGGLFDMGSCSDQYTWVEGYTLVNIGGVLSSAHTNYSTVGSQTSAHPTPAVSVIVRRQTARAGKAFRGHFSMPAGYIAESEVDAAGIIASTPLAALQTRATASFNAAVAQTLTPNILHSNAAVPPTPVTAFLVQSLIGTQRKRIKRT